MKNTKDNHIKITDDNISVHLPVESGLVPLSLVKKYFPDASTLSYLEDGKLFGVKNTVDNKVVIKSGVTEYMVYKSSKSQMSSKSMHYSLISNCIVL